MCVFCMVCLLAHVRVMCAMWGTLAPACVQVNYILDEIIQGGMVVETCIPDIVAAINEGNALAAK